MARKRKMNRAASKPGGPATPPKHGAVQGGARTYQLKKLNKLRARGKESEALAVLDRLWSARGIERLDWLLVHWPEQAVEALEAWWLADEAAEVLLVLDQALLAMSPAGVALVVPALPVGWHAQLQHVLTASAALAREEDVEAKAALKAMGRRTLFERSQRFLRGLLAWYHNDEGRALSVWSGLPSEGRLAKGVSALRLGPNGQALLEPMLTALHAQKAGVAVKAAGAVFAKLDHPTQLLVARALPGALMAMGINSSAAHQRTARGLPGVEAVVEPAHWPALAWEGGLEADGEVGPPGSWTTYMERTNLSRTAEAAVLVHIAEKSILMLEVINSVVSEDWLRSEARGMDAQLQEMKSYVVAALEGAVGANPCNERAWRLLIERSQQQTAAARARILERYVAALPGSPDALLHAAGACALRSAWDKGLRYATRAVALLPLERKPRDLMATMLAGKARKRAGDGRHEQARVLYERAITVENQSVLSGLTIQVVYAVHLGLQGDTQRAQAIEAKAIAATPYPWLWLAYEWRERCRIGPWTMPPKVLDVLPDPNMEELMGLLAVDEALDAGREGREYAWRLTAQALERPLPDGLSVDDVERLLEAADDRAAFHLSVIAHRAEPEEPRWLFEQYANAIGAEMEPDVFVTANADMTTALDRHRETCSDRRCVFETQFESLITRVDEYLLIMDPVDEVGEDREETRTQRPVEQLALGLE